MFQISLKMFTYLKYSVNDVNKYWIKKGKKKIRHKVFFYFFIKEIF